MSILIPNLNLPKGCGDCLFRKEYHVLGRDGCAIDPFLLIDGLEFTRHKDCPLRETAIGNRKEN